MLEEHVIHPCLRIGNTSYSRSQLRKCCGGLLWLSRIGYERREKKVWKVSSNRWRSWEVFFPLMAMTLGLIRDRKPKWQHTNSPVTVYQKNLLPSHTLSLFSVASLGLSPTRQQAVCLPSTSHSWGTGRIKPPSKRRRLSVVASWTHLSKPRNREPQRCFTPASSCYQQLQSIVLCCRPVPDQPVAQQGHWAGEHWI